MIHYSTILSTYVKKMNANKQSISAANDKEHPI